MHLGHRLALAALISLQCGGVALAAPAPRTPEVRAAVTAELVRCRAETDPTARLACFDKAVAALDEAEQKGQVVVLDREAMHKARREAFGFDLPFVNMFRRSAGPEERVDRVTFSIDHAGRTGDGHWLFATTEGASWVQTDDETLLRPPHAGSNLLVMKGALGSFFCKVDGQQALRCLRQR